MSGDSTEDQNVFVVEPNKRLCIFMCLDLSCALDVSVGWAGRRGSCIQSSCLWNIRSGRYSWISSRRMWLQLAIASLTYPQGNVSSNALVPIFLTGIGRRQWFCFRVGVGSLDPLNEILDPHTW